LGRSQSIYYRWYESSHLSSFLRLTSFLGTPEAGPGTILGHPIRFINATKDLSPGATPKWTGSGVPHTTSPTSASTRGSSLNARAIAGAFVGRVAAFSIICAAIFYLRRRRPRAQSPSMSDDVHHPEMENTWKSPSDRTSVDTSTLTETLTAMTKPYVRVFVPCVALAGGHSNFQDPTDSSMFPRNQRALRTLIMFDQVPS
jgi:hypothetical protein